MKTITHDQYLQLRGLFAIAVEHRNVLQSMGALWAKAAAGVLAIHDGGTTSFGVVGDEVWATDGTADAFGYPRAGGETAYRR